MRKLSLVAVVLFGTLWFVPTVSAQIYIYNPCTDLSLGPQVQVNCAFAAMARARSGYPVYDGYGQVVERRNGVSPVEVGMGGAVVGGAYGGWKGAVAGGTIGYFGTKGIGAIMDHHRQKRDEMSRRSQQQSQQQPPPPQSNQGMTGSAANPSPGPYFNQDQGGGELKLVNNSGVYLDVYDGKKFYIRMPPGDVRQVPFPQDRYWAKALIPNDSGGVSQGNPETQADDRGLTFNRPAVVRGR